MVNKKCERDVWSSGKNGENNAEKEQSRRSRQGRRAFRTRQLYRAFTLRPPEKARQRRRGRGGHLQLGRCLGAGQAVQREQCIQQVPDGHRARKDVFHAPKRSFRAGGLARENKNVYTQYKEKETGEPDGAEIIGLKPKRRFSACQKIRQPKRKDLGIY